MQHPRLTHVWRGPSIIDVKVGAPLECDATSLRGKVLRVSVANYPPFTMFDSGGLDFHGIEVETMAIVAEKYGFTMDFVPEETWIFFNNETGHWDGVIGKVRDSAPIGADFME